MKTDSEDMLPHHLFPFRIVTASQWQKPVGIEYRLMA